MPKSRRYLRGREVELYGAGDRHALQIRAFLYRSGCLPMKTIFLLITLALASPLLAQEAVEDLPAPAQPGSELGEPVLIPENVPDIPKPSRDFAIPDAQEEFRKSKTGIAVSEIEKRVRFRKAETQAWKNPKFQEMQDDAKAAGTYLERRAILRDYYNSLYDSMLKIDPSLTELVELTRKEKLGRLDQNRLRELGSDAALFSAQ